MNADTLKRLALGLAAVVILWAIAGGVRRSQRDADQRLALARLDPKAVDGATLTKGSDTLRFTRQGSGWAVNGHPANGAFVEAMLAAVGDTAAPSELIAESVSSYAGLGLDSASAVRLSVHVTGSTRPIVLLLGHRGGTWGTVNVRLPDSGGAYQVKGALADIVDRPLDDWRDKTIARVPTDSVASIVVGRGRTTYALTRGNRGWSIDGRTADSSAVANLLNQLKDVRASGFATAAQAGALDFAKPARTIRITSVAGKGLLSLAADSMASGFWVRTDGDSTVYRMDSYTFNQLGPADSTLRKK